MKNSLINMLIALLLVWAYQDFYTFDKALAFMNSLSEAQKEKAYIIPLNSARSGAFNGYYTVVYPN